MEKHKVEKTLHTVQEKHKYSKKKFVLFLLTKEYDDGSFKAAYCRTMTVPCTCCFGNHHFSKTQILIQIIMTRLYSKWQRLLNAIA